MIIFLIPSFLLHLLVGILLFRDITSYCIFVYLYLAVADLRCCTWAFSSCGDTAELRLPLCEMDEKPKRELLRQMKRLGL